MRSRSMGNSLQDPKERAALHSNLGIKLKVPE